MKETELIKISAKGGILTRQEQEQIRRAGEILRAGGLVAFPTETVYGLGGDALSPDSSRKIYAAKGRPSDNPLIIHIADFSALTAIVSEVPETAVKLAEAFWPGPLTMILHKSAAVPYETTGGLDTVAVRMPSHPVALALIRAGGGYVAAPSANLSGKPSPTRAAYVVQDMDGRIDAIIDNGALGIGLESTIVDLTVTPPQILRPGYITREMLERVLEEVTVDETVLHSEQECGLAPKAPGMKYRHYAPQGELTVVRGKPEDVAMYIHRKSREDLQAGEKVGVISTAEMLERYRINTASFVQDASRKAAGESPDRENKALVIKSVGSRDDEEAIARRLYAILREFDDEKVTRIYSEAFSAEGFGQAIMNRLLKAAGHQVVDV